MEQTRAPARPLWDRIQAICAERGWNAVRLERETGVTRQTIAKWRTAPRAPQATTVNTVAKVLGIELTEALRLAGVIPPDETAAEEPKDEWTLEEARAEIAELRAEMQRLQNRDKQEDVGG